MDHAIDISLDDKWTQPKGRIFLSGTQAIVRVLIAQAELDKRAGLNTAGYISGYRGSPLGNVDTALWSVKSRLAEAGVVFHPGVNEDIAATAVAGTQQIDQLPGARHEGVFAAWYGKGPGVDRSGDAFKHGNYAGAHAKGGVLIFFGDDHAGKSSTVAFQSEQAIVASSIPILYPADPGELIEYGLFGYALSRHSGSWVSIKCVNEIVEQAGTFDIDLDGFAATLPELPPPPPEGIHARRRAFSPLRDEQIVNEHRMPLIGPFIRANRIDRTIFRGPAPRLGLVAAGKSYGDTRQALEILGLDEEACHRLGVALYKPGCIWPLEAEGLVEFSQGLQSLFVIEEKKAFVEVQAASIFINRDGAPRIVGKRDEAGQTILSETISLEPAAIALAICNRLELLAPLPAHLTDIRDRLRGKSGSVAVPLEVRRAPFFCSGCPHTRSTRIPEGSHAMSGIGCHGMVSFVRPEETLTPMQMGAEGANWLGMAPFTDLPHIFQNMGDGTYYHSGLLAIRAAVASGANITYKILYNDAVAMTGGQPVDGPLSVAEIAQQLRHEGVGRIVVLSDNPDYHRRTGGFPEGVTIGHRDTLDAVQRELREITGVTGLIYEQTCAAEKRRRRKRGTFPNPAKRMFIAHQVCEGCGDCSEQSSCVSIAPRETGLGRKRMIDQSSCNKDFSCNRGFCPSFITVYDAEPRKPEGIVIDESWFGDIPAPMPAALGSESFNLMVAGIGGTGVITVGALLGMAAHIDGKAASLFDMTGLAQKNGAVYSHIRDGWRVRRLGLDADRRRRPGFRGDVGRPSPRGRHERLAPHADSGWRARGPAGPARPLCTPGDACGGRQRQCKRIDRRAEALLFRASPDLYRILHRNGARIGHQLQHPDLVPDAPYPVLRPCRAGCGLFVRNGGGRHQPCRRPVAAMDRAANGREAPLRFNAYDRALRMLPVLTAAYRFVARTERRVSDPDRSDTLHPAVRPRYPARRDGAAAGAAADTGAARCHLLPVPVADRARHRSHARRVARPECRLAEGFGPRSLGSDHPDLCSGADRCDPPEPQRLRKQLRKRRVSCAGGRNHPPLAQILPVSSGTALNRSATRPKSATWKIGASSSLLIATIVFESFMPARCWIAPEMPSAK